MSARRLLVIFSLLVAATSLRAQDATESRSDAISAEPTPIEPPKPKRKPAADADTASASSSESIADRARRLNMTPEQFTSAGLDKLTPDQLANLERSIKGQTAADTRAAKRAEAEARRAQMEAEKAQAEAQKKAAARPRVDEYNSRVDGTLDRLTGRSIIRLEDGTMWKQANSEDRYPAPVKDHPSARVFRSFGGYKMRISGIPEFYVDPVRQ